MRRRLTFFLRYMVGWPVIIVLALNIESIANAYGFGSIISDNLRNASGVLGAMYNFLTSWVVTGLALFFAGAICNSWLMRNIENIEGETGWIRRTQAGGAASYVGDALLYRPWMRKFFQLEKSIPDLNMRLTAFGLPLVPDKSVLDENPKLNSQYAIYLQAIAPHMKAGRIEFAKEIGEKLVSQFEATSLEPQLPPDTATETPPKNHHG